MTREHHMRRALELAEAGRGRVHPNPLVGAVLVKNDRVIGEGFHRRFGGPHAEIEALEDATRHLGAGAARGATLFVTLEPCCHQGKTPPCVDAIIAAGIEDVVYAIDDPNPLVAGKGGQKLRAAGVKVTTGVGSAEARTLNESFLHFHILGRPFVIWKVARSLLGGTALVEGRRSKLTDAAADAVVDKMRAQSDAVVIGATTAVVDDPGLRIREGLGRDPWRVILDAELKTPASCRLIRNNPDKKTLVVTAVKASDERHRALIDAGVEIIGAPPSKGGLDLSTVLRLLGERGLIELLVESGGRLGRALLEAGLVDRVVTFETPVWAPGVSGRFTAFDRIGEDIRVVWEPR